MEAEVIAVKEGLEYCVRKGINKVQVQTDSLALKLMLNREWRVPWELIETVEQI